MAKRRIMFEETYKKGISILKENVIDTLNNNETDIFLLKTGKFDDDSEFMTIRIEVK